MNRNDEHLSAEDIYLAVHSGAPKIGLTTVYRTLNLLKDLGVSIRPVPLGGGDASSTVRHKDAWWVSYGGEADTSVLATALGYPTIVMIELGGGTVTIIGDGRLMLDESLESEFKGAPDNIRFILDLVEDLRIRQEHEIASRY